MQTTTHFDFAALQLKHPEAFFLRLSYSRFKFRNACQNLYFMLSAGLLCLSLAFITQAIHIVFTQYLGLDVKLSFHLATLSMCMLCYGYVWYAQYQAQHSSTCFSQRLQLCLYIQSAIFSVLSVNYYVFQLDWLIMLSLLVMALSSVCAVLIEPLFKPSSAVSDHVKLQKIRQLAYWSHLQIKQHQALAEKQYYIALKQNCLAEENKLLHSIRFESFKAYYK